MYYIQTNHFLKYFILSLFSNGMFNVGNKFLNTVIQMTRKNDRLYRALKYYNKTISIKKNSRIC